MEPVYPNTRPRPEEQLQYLVAFAAPGQFEPVTLTLFPIRALANLKVRASPLEESVSWDEPRKDEEDVAYEESEYDTLADILTAEEQAGAWERIDPGEQQRIVEQALSRIAPRQRQTMLVHILDGFDSAEIAMIQDRDEKEILADIRGAQEALRKGVLGEIGHPAELSPAASEHRG